MNSVIFFRNIRTDQSGCMTTQYAPTSIFKTHWCVGFNLPTCYVYCLWGFCVSVISYVRSFKENVKEYQESVIMNSTSIFLIRHTAVYMSKKLLLPRLPVREWLHAVYKQLWRTAKPHFVIRIHTEYCAHSLCCYIGFSLFFCHCLWIVYFVSRAAI